MKKTYQLHDNKKLLSYLQKLQKEGYPFVLSSSTASQTEKNLDYLVLRKIYPTIISGSSSFFKVVFNKEINSSIYRKTTVTPYIR